VGKRVVTQYVGAACGVVEVPHLHYTLHLLVEIVGNLYVFRQVWILFGTRYIHKKKNTHQAIVQHRESCGLLTDVN
jgi:hypothetical protein